MTLTKIIEAVRIIKDNLPVFVCPDPRKGEEGKYLYLDFMMSAVNGVGSWQAIGTSQLETVRIWIAFTVPVESIAADLIFEHGILAEHRKRILEKRAADAKEQAAIAESMIPKE